MANDPRPIGEKLRSIDEHADRPMQANENRGRPSPERPRSDSMPKRDEAHRNPEHVPPRGTEQRRK